MIAYSPAKINIGIRILNKRSDGFHNLHSYLYPVPLFDILEIKKSNSDQLFQSGFVSTTKMQENLVYKALQLLRNEISIPPLKIHLHKQIPFQAGLGGGSGDAITFIKLVLLQFNLSLSGNKTQEIAEKLGSDCPFFIDPKAAEVKGRGEMVRNINWSLKGLKIIIVKPNFAIKTADAFSEIKTQDKELPSVSKVRLEDYQKYFTNAFETQLSDKYPLLKEIKEKLLKSGAIYASLSGSGSAVFGLSYHSINIKFPSSYFIWNGELQ